MVPFSLSDLNLLALLPELLIIGFAVLVMMVDIFTSPDPASAGRRSLPWVALAGAVVAIAASLWLFARPAAAFQQAAVLDPFALGLRLIVYIATALAILVGVNYIPTVTRQIGEYYTLLLLTASGMTMMGASTDLIITFLALEIFSLALYILTGLNRRDPRSSEASMKYFLLGAFSSAFFVYGAALVFGATGTTQYAAIAAALADGPADLALLYPGIALLLVGFGFKVGLVPFHMWTPDVYQGAPTPVTAFMSVGTKAAAFAALFRVFVVALPSAQPLWSWALAVLAIITMVLGNFVALRQSSLKRMLAYSSIAHAGYILVGLVPGTETGAYGALFYLFAYAFMNIGAFAVAMALEKEGEMDAVQKRAAGISRPYPLLAAVMAIFMFALAGVPPTAGFFGKFFVFRAAVEGGWAWLAAVAMLNAVVGATYYLRVVVSMYFDQPGAETAAGVLRGRPLQVGLALAAALTLIVGSYPGLWTGLFRQGLALLGG